MTSLPASPTYREMLDAMRRRNREPQLLAKELDSLKPVLDIGDVRSCVSIGTGYGELDLLFIERFMPKLRTLTAVEPDMECAVELTGTVDRRLKSNVCLEICRQKVGEWKGATQPVDVVLLFHFTYYISSPERIQLVNRLFHQIVTPGGFVAFLHVHEVEDNDDSLLTVVRRLDPDAARAVYTDGEVDRMMLQGGFSLYFEHVYPKMVNVEELDDVFLSNFRCYVDAELDEIRTVAEQVFAGKKETRELCRLAVFRKP